MQEENRSRQNERQRLYYEANKQKILERRRQLYAEGGKEKDKEYYLKKKGTPEYKEHHRNYMRKYREANRPADYDKEAVRRTKNRKIGATLANKKKVAKPKKNPNKTWLDSIPDLSIPFCGSEESHRGDTRGVLALLYR